MKTRRRAPKKCLAATKKLHDLVAAFVLQHGAVETDFYRAHKCGYEWRLMTVHGPFEVSVHVDDGGWLTVFGRFEHPEKAKHLPPWCSPHSGKWNVHGGHCQEGATPEAVFQQWKREAQPLLAVPEPRKQAS